MTHPCAVLVWDRKATRESERLVTRPCGAPSTHVVSISNDQLFAVCSRHNGRLERDGVKAA